MIIKGELLRGDAITLDIDENNQIKWDKK